MTNNNTPGTDDFTSELKKKIFFWTQIESFVIWSLNDGFEKSAFSISNTERRHYRVHSVSATQKEGIIVCIQYQQQRNKASPCAFRISNRERRHHRVHSVSATEK